MARKHGNAAGDDRGDPYAASSSSRRVRCVCLLHDVSRFARAAGAPPDGRRGAGAVPLGECGRRRRTGRRLRRLRRRRGEAAARARQPVDQRELGRGVALDVVHGVIGHEMNGPTTGPWLQRRQHSAHEGQPGVPRVRQTALTLGGTAQQQQVTPASVSSSSAHVVGQHIQGWRKRPSSAERVARHPAARSSVSQRSPWTATMRRGARSGRPPSARAPARRAPRPGAGARAHGQSAPGAGRRRGGRGRRQGLWRSSPTLPAPRRCAASVRFSRGLVVRARGDSAEAKRDLEDAVDLSSRMRAPYELARGRMALAELALQAGRTEEATRELRQAQAALDGLSAPSELEPGRGAAGPRGTLSGTRITAPRLLRRRSASARRRLRVRARSGGRVPTGKGPVSRAPSEASMRPRRRFQLRHPCRRSTCDGRSSMLR